MMSPFARIGYRLNDVFDLPIPNHSIAHCDRDGGRTGVDVELGKDMFDMRRRGAGADEKNIGDFTARTASRYQTEDVKLAVAQPRPGRFDPIERFLRRQG